MATPAVSACPAPMTATSNGAWEGDNPLHHSLPLIILQICIVVVITRSLAFVLRPLHQPRVIAEIIEKETNHSEVLRKTTSNLQNQDEDESCLSNIRASLSSSASEGSLKYVETAAAEKSGIISAIKNLGPANIFLTGRSPPVVSLVEHSDSPELGPLGSYLALSEFSTTASVLVLRRYNPSSDSSSLEDMEAVGIIDVPDTPLASVTPESSLHNR